MMWLLLIPAVFLAALIVVRLLDKPERNNVRELPHECWAACSHPSHYRPQIPSVADAFPFDSK